MAGTLTALIEKSPTSPRAARSELALLFVAPGGGMGDHDRSLGCHGQSAADRAEHAFSERAAAVVANYEQVGFCCRGQQDAGWTGRRAARAAAPVPHCTRREMVPNFLKVVPSSA